MSVKAPLREKERRVARATLYNETSKGKTKWLFGKGDRAAVRPDLSDELYRNAPAQRGSKVTEVPNFSKHF